LKTCKTLATKTKTTRHFSIAGRLAFVFVVELFSLWVSFVSFFLSFPILPPPWVRGESAFFINSSRRKMDGTNKQKNKGGKQKVIKKKAISFPKEKLPYSFVTKPIRFLVSAGVLLHVYPATPERMIK